ncbi:MAG: arylsulfatase A-like enzyme [Mariniblastus sp.]|jgi:arylsulfatase A-like enzyme
MLTKHSLVLPLFALLVSANLTLAEKPNIVLIFADDQGWKDVGYQSGGKFLTPNIDRLTTQGMVFTDAYAAAGNCAPSRACLLSGNYTPRHHVYAVNSTARGPKEIRRVVPIPNRSGLAPDVLTMAEALKAAGYATGHFGKWHLAGDDGALPSEQGFDETFDSFGDGELKEGSKGNKKGPPHDPKGVFALTHRACDFIERNQDKPFFCYLPHHAIHGPLQLTPATKLIIEKHNTGNKPSTAYLGCTYDMDASVGILLSKLKELDLEKNTLVIYTSDNGSTSASSQEPLRGNKGCYYEGGIREPFVARWPGVIVPGETSSVPISLVDLFPTFLDAAGASVPAAKKLDGESLLPLFKQEGDLQRSAIFWHFPGYLNQAVTRGRDPVFRTRPVSVIRKGDWKLHLYHEEWNLDGGMTTLESNDSVELYNMADDIGERNNLASAQTATRDELLGDLLAWIESTEAKFASEPNLDYDANAHKQADAAQKKKGNRRKK